MITSAPARMYCSWTRHVGLLQVRLGAPRHVVHRHALSLKLSASAAIDDHQLTVGEPPETSAALIPNPLQLSACRQETAFSCPYTRTDRAGARLAGACPAPSYRRAR
jgi:hypothetical protein